ncbi:MAG: hypothetical protein P4L77_13095 [Sulfuriferula sp.]|nr:hypothetical protein [Sulfuriferula sp.]
MMPDMIPIDEAKMALKEAATEWLNSKLAVLGKWTLAALLAMALAGIFRLIVHFGK